MSDTKTIPIFPLELVLFPRQELPLRIFEPRYKQLIDDCMISDGQFGVCLVDETKTILGWQAPCMIGTAAKITQCSDIDMAGMQLYVQAIGRSKFRINKIIPPVIPLPYDYDPYSPDGHIRMAELQEKEKTKGKLYLRAEIELIPEITDNITLEQWKHLVEIWKQKILTQALPKIINPFELDQLLAGYGLVSDIPTIDYVYSLAALGASSPTELQEILEAENITSLIQKTEELFEKR